MTAPDPLGPVLITTRDIYDALIRLTETVHRLVDQGSGHGDDIRDHENRLRALEANRWPASPLTIALTIVALLIGGAGLVLNLTGGTP